MSHYIRQRARARALIVNKGTTCTWYKQADADSSDDTSPEFPTDETQLQYTVPIVFYPANRQSMLTVMEIMKTGQVSDQLLGVIPGDLPFKPSIDDAVLLTYGDGTTGLFHVATINTTQPDLLPIIYEVTFK